MVTYHLFFWRAGSVETSQLLTSTCRSQIAAGETIDVMGWRVVHLFYHGNTDGPSPVATGMREVGH